MVLNNYQLEDGRLGGEFKTPKIEREKEFKDEEGGSTQKLDSEINDESENQLSEFKLLKN